MKAILIDSEARDIREVEAEGLKDYYRLLDCDMIEAATYIGSDCVIVDEEGLLKAIKYSFSIKGAHQPAFAGKGIVIGSDASTGDTVDVKHSVEQLKELIFFPIHSKN
jgi:hypothetical protein